MIIGADKMNAGGLINMIGSLDGWGDGLRHTYT
jgi:hypothetical protein